MHNASPSRRQLLTFVAAALGTLSLSGLLEACTTAPASVAAPTSAPAVTKPATLGKLTVSYGSPVGSFAPLWMAKAIGAFDKYGVTVDVQYIETATAVPAIVANQIEAEEVSAAPIITADANGDLDLVLIGSVLNHPILGLYANADITSPDQLRGKIVASDKPGTPTDYACRLSLSLLGLSPTDVDLRIVGSAAEVTPAMLTGQVAAGVVAPPQAFQVEAKGYHLLKGIFDQPYQNVGVVAKRSRLDELGPGLRALLAAIRDGILAWNSQPDLAMKIQDEYAKVGDPDVLRKSYDFYIKTAPFEPTLQPTLPGIKAMMDFLAPSAPKIANYTPEHFIDTRFLNQLPT
ncbi:MAG TPA: ABC transporter substrate-binding protein [Chloroflexota bacterium]|jgi:NitT/TauT family transport system substrate-binding protein|nr:ABC transporter substrate-binding protein [Chloroflexota bacterium]